MDLAPRFSVSEFIEVANQTLDYAFPAVEIEGEVSGFKISKDRWVFFDLKDKESTVGCFMPIYQLHIPLEDGMKVVVGGTPKLAKFGKFSITVKKIMPVGEGSIKKAFELLKEKLTKEGLFDPAKKRPVPEDLQTIGVISSIQAAGYADFCKILNDRWGGLDVRVANCGVQGLGVVDDLCRAIDYFNEEGTVQVIAIIRGGGSKDDLAVFNDETLARKIASSRIPIITGIGHEIDESLADLAADIRASTPTNAAEMLTRDKTDEIARIYDNLTNAAKYIMDYVDATKTTTLSTITSVNDAIKARFENATNQLQNQLKILESFNPETVLRQGYAILSGNLSPGNIINITTHDKLITARIENVNKR